MREERYAIVSAIIDYAGETATHIVEKIKNGTSI